MATRCRAARCSSGRLWNAAQTSASRTACSCGGARASSESALSRSIRLVSASLPAQAVDEDVVKNGQQPGAQVAVRSKLAAPLVGPDQRVVHQVLRIGAVAQQGTGIAAQGRKLAKHVEAGPIGSHDVYTEPASNFIPRRASKVAYGEMGGYK